MPKTSGDELFERYLCEHDYDPGQHEPDLSEHEIQKRPDYLPERAGARAACEVEQFTAGGSKLERRILGQSFFSAGSDEVYGPIRRCVSRAAAQLKPLTVLELPLVVVVANPEGAFVDLSVPHVIAALYGNPQFALQIDTSTGAAVDEGHFELGRDGKLTNDHPYLSAVALLRRRDHRTDAVEAISAEHRAEHPDGFESTADETTSLLERLDEAELPEGDYLYLDVIQTMSESAVPLPDDWFDGPHDSRWRYKEENDEGFYERAWGPPINA